jgi:hypothetical protein
LLRESRKQALRLRDLSHRKSSVPHSIESPKRRS